MAMLVITKGYPMYQSWPKLSYCQNTRHKMILQVLLHPSPSGASDPKLQPRNSPSVIAIPSLLCSLDFHKHQGPSKEGSCCVYPLMAWWMIFPWFCKRLPGGSSWRWPMFAWIYLFLSFFTMAVLVYPRVYHRVLMVYKSSHNWRHCLVMLDLSNQYGSHDGHIMWIAKLIWS